MGTDTRRRDLVLALLAFLGASLFGLNTAGYAGNEAFAAAVLAMILPLLFGIEGPAPVKRPGAPAGTSLPWRIAILLCSAVMLWQVVMGRAEQQRSFLSLFLSVSSAAQAIGFLRRAGRMGRARIVRSVS